MPPARRRVVTHHALGTTGLQHHDRHAVRDHVVQLAGDPGALGSDGLRRLLPEPLVALGEQSSSSCRDDSTRPTDQPP